MEMTAMWDQGGKWKERKIERDYTSSLRPVQCQTDSFHAVLCFKMQRELVQWSSS